MSLDQGYGVLKGRAVERKLERADSRSPHFQIWMKAGNEAYRVAVNVKSVQVPVDLLYFVNNNFRHRLTSQLVGLQSGFHPIPASDRKAGGIAVDYIRSNLFDVRQMTALPANVSGAENDLFDILDLYVQRALNNPNADLYAFGEPWGPEPTADKVFGFKPGRGVHNIHMNQGNRKPHDRENGVYQDGALLFHFRDRNQWVAAFFAFQSQAFHTDDRTGAPIAAQTGVEPVSGGEPAVHADMRIIAALVNPPGEDPGKETVTLINTTANPIDLDGWAISDRLKRKVSLRGSILPGETMKVLLTDDMQLGNDGGIITLLNQDGIKVDGVSYTKTDVQAAGRTIVF